MLVAMSLETELTIQEHTRWFDRTHAEWFGEDGSGLVMEPYTNLILFLTESAMIMARRQVL